jgi:hypothetical protein
MSEQELPAFVAILARDWSKGDAPIQVKAADMYDAGRIAADELNAGLEDLILVWPVDDYLAGKEPLTTIHAGNVRFNRVLRPAGEVGEAPPRLNILRLDDNEFVQILSGLYGVWDRLTDELSAGPTDDNPGWEEDALVWAIRDNQALLVKLVDMRPEFKYLVADAIKRLL